MAISTDANACTELSQIGLIETVRTPIEPSHVMTHHIFEILPSAVVV